MKNNNCYLCSSDDLKLLKEGTRTNPKVNILKCSRCGLEQLDSFQHMSEKYYEESTMTYPLKCLLDEERRIDQLKEVLLQKDVLEFGSGLGSFCCGIKKYVNKIVGVDLDSQAKNVYDKNNIPFFHDIDDLKNDSFDSIVMFHVLEHIEDPIQQLIELKTLLKPGGSIYIEVPNANDALLTIYKSEDFKTFNANEEHLYTFNSENLKCIANKAGLEVGYVKQIQRYPLSNHIVWLQDSKPLGQVKYDFLNDQELNASYSSALSKVGSCDTLFAKFVKGDNEYSKR